jgi:Ca2+-binding EF-hand superfamily protein
MSNDATDRVRSAFESFDTDGNGLIDFDEFLDMIERLYPGTSATYLEAGFVLMDTNQDGYIDLQEFLEWWRDEDWDALMAEKT